MSETSAILPASNKKAITVEVGIREVYRVRPITPANKMVNIPDRVRDLLGELSSYDQAVQAGQLLLALSECEGFSIDKTFRKVETLVDGIALTDTPADPWNQEFSVDSVARGTVR